MRKNIDPDFWLHVAIESWAWDYHLGTAFRQDDPDPLSEMRTLEVNGTLVQGGSRSAKAGLRTKIRVYTSPHLREDKRMGNKNIEHVGSLDRVKGGYEGAIFIPDDALPLVLLMLLHNRYEHINIAALKDGRLTSRVQSFEFTKTMTGDWD